MSTIKQAILDLKKTEQEARKLAEQQLIKEGKTKLDEMVSKLMEDLSPKEDKDDDEIKTDDSEEIIPSSDVVDDNKPIEPETTTPIEEPIGSNDTRNVGGEFNDFLGDELGKDKPIEIEITIDTNPDKDETPITPVIKTDTPVIAPTTTTPVVEPVIDDMSDSDDIDQIMEKFNERFRNR